VDISALEFLLLVEFSRLDAMVPASSLSVFCSVRLLFAGLHDPPDIGVTP